MASDTNPAPDYNTKTCKQLRAILATRKIQHKDLKSKAKLLAAVHESSVRKRKADQELEREHAKKLKLEYDDFLAQVREPDLRAEGASSQALRAILHSHDEQKRAEEASRCRDELWREIFQRDFEADPTRKSFTDLPREIRDMCYGYVFDNAELTETRSIIDYNPKRDCFELRDYRSGDWGDRFLVITFAVLKLSTLNKVIRKETRATFWSLFNHELVSDVKKVTKGSYDWAFYDGRFGATVLSMPKSSCSISCGLIPQDLTDAGYSTFTRVCDMLRDCVSLNTLRLTVVEHYLFHDEQEALENVLLQGKALISQGLGNFQKLLTSLPKLQVVEIDVLPMASGAPHLISTDISLFMRYAFTGARRSRIWAMTKTILEETELQMADGHILVNTQSFVYEGLNVELEPNPEFGLADFEQWLVAQDSEAGDSGSTIPYVRKKRRGHFALLDYCHSVGRPDKEHISSTV